MQSFAILYASGQVDLFVEPAKIEGLTTHLGPDVNCHPVERFLDALGELTGAVRLAAASCPVAVAERVGERVQWGDDPCALPKACKNAAEIKGASAAHVRDGAAVVEVLAWLDSHSPGSLTETQVVTRLEEVRRQDTALQDILSLIHI